MAAQENGWSIHRASVGERLPVLASMKTDGLLSVHFRQDAMHLLTRHIRHICRLFSENLAKKTWRKKFPPISG
jgi:hypothetical protein